MGEPLDALDLEELEGRLFDEAAAELAWRWRDGAALFDLIDPDEGVIDDD